MARSRSIKPGFFKNEVLAVLPPNDKLTFIGLWTLADRAGRLEDRPLRIKAEIFPYFDMDVEGSLYRLAKAGFILRYQIAGNKYICIPTWSKHQSPHIKECASTIPAPCEHQSSPPDSLFSDSLPPDCLNPEPYVPEPGTSGDTRAVIAHPVTKDPDFQGFIGIFVSLGVGLSETDLRRCAQLWVSLESREKQAAQAHAVGPGRREWARREERYVPRPWNYLTDKPWTRRAVVNGRDEPATKGEIATLKAKEMYRKESKLPL